MKAIVGARSVKEPGIDQSTRSNQKSTKVLRSLAAALTRSARVFSETSRP
jgi:hypothetical protein